ncbi:signal peptidase II [Candidatus Uhrbacteria bacterium]|nr:signal peptidase II [Candidatus Uhrbacteria bacterium]
MNARRLALSLVITALVATVDQFTKQIFFAKPDLMSGFTFAKSFVQFTDYHNYGITFSLAFPQIATITLTIIFCVVILFWMMRLVRRGEWMSALALAILLGGAIGNVIDRITLGYVRDWLLFFGRSAVNSADGAIALGGIWFFIRQSRKKTPPVPGPNQV